MFIPEYLSEFGRGSGGAIYSASRPLKLLEWVRDSFF